MSSEVQRHDKLTITGLFHDQEVNVPVEIIEVDGRLSVFVRGEPIDCALVTDADHILNRILLKHVRFLPVDLKIDIEHPLQGVATFLI